MDYREFTQCTGNGLKECEYYINKVSIEYNNVKIVMYIVFDTKCYANNKDI